jgi:serine/threonine protein phosphatase PrpC
MLAKRLLTEALDRGTDDNTTVVVVFLQDLK